LDVLIVRPAALGDTLMLLPPLDRLRQKAAVTLVGRSPGTHFLKPFVRQVLDFESMGWHTLFTENPEITNLPRADVVVAFLRDDSTSLRKNLEFLFRTRRIHIFPGLPPAGERVHAALHLARCLQEAGLIEDPEECVRSAERRALLLDGRPARRETILFHPGSGGRAKNHSPEFWLRLIETLGAHPDCGGYRQRLLLGPAEEGLRPFFSEHLTRDWNGEVIFSPGLDELSLILGKGALYLGQDSGITHLAAMTDVPSIALFKADNVSTWRPLGPRVSVIRKEESSELASQIVEEAARLLRAV
jgi:heptosyltransferase III